MCSYFLNLKMISKINLNFSLFNRVVLPKDFGFYDGLQMNDFGSFMEIRIILIQTDDSDRICIYICTGPLCVFCENSIV